MESYKVYHAEVYRYGEPAIILTTADDDSGGGFSLAEYHLMIPDKVNTLRSNMLSFDVASFNGSPVVLDIAFMHAEACGQAQAELRGYLWDLDKAGNGQGLGSGAISETSNNAIAAACLRGSFPQLSKILQNTKSLTLKEALGRMLSFKPIRKQAF